jgi:NTP pyrophosphatase (non-canonical NTP hydrolase)
MNLRQLQTESAEWRAVNFPKTTGDQQLKGMVEELGELAHADLKGEQKIRGYNARLVRLAREDAIGDLIIFLAGYCTCHHLDLDDIVSETWARVKGRNWVLYPETGEPG